MSRLKWDQVGEKRYKTGVDHGVLYLQKNGIYPKGVVWNGITTITESPSGAEDNALYADNIKYLNLKSVEEFGCSVECYTYPDEWNACNGIKEVTPGVFIGQQKRDNFGLSYRTRLGNDTEGDDYGYELHLVYGCSSSPSETTNNTVNDSPEANTFSYEITTTPVQVEMLDPDGNPYRPTASITIDSTRVSKEKMAAIENILYGADSMTLADDDETSTDARLPLPDEIFSILAAEDVA